MITAVINTIAPQANAATELQGYIVATLLKRRSRRVFCPARKYIGKTEVFTIHEFYNVSSTAGIDALKKAKQELKNLKSVYADYD